MEVLLVERRDTTVTHLRRCKPECLREAAVITPIAHRDPPLIAAKATGTETETGTGTGTGTVIVTGIGIRTVAAADGTKNPTRTTIADIPLLHVVNWEPQKNTYLAAIVKARAIENIPRGTEMTITATDLPPIDTDRLVRSTTAMTTTKIRGNAGDADTRNETVKRTAIGENTTIFRNRPPPMTMPRCTTTEGMPGVTSMTLEANTLASTDTGRTPMRYQFRIIS